MRLGTASCLLLVLLDWVTDGSVSYVDTGEPLLMGDPAYSKALFSYRGRKETPQTLDQMVEFLTADLCSATSWDVDARLRRVNVLPIGS